MSNRSHSSKLADFVNGGQHGGESTPCGSYDGSGTPRNFTGSSNTDNNTASERGRTPKCGIPVVVTKCCEQNSDSPGRRLVNVDAMEELCYFAKNDDGKYDCYQVCDCCGVMTKYCGGDDGDDSNSCTPVKYARRQRFTFNDDKPNSKIYSPPWPFNGQCICCPDPCSGNNGCGPTIGCCGNSEPYKGGVSCAGEDGLPNKSGVYYFNKTKNKLVFQSRRDTKSTSGLAAPGTPTSSNGSCDDSLDKPPVVIQPYVIPPPPACGNSCGNGGGSCGSPCMPYCNPYCCNPCGGCCNPCGGCCNPCGGCCNPCGGCCNPCGGCCNPCGGCCSPCGGCCNPCGGCCNPCGGCCNPCGGCCNPCGGCCNPCCSPCAPNCTNVNVPQPPPPAPGQTTVIPMCIPINPPSFCPPPPCCMPCCKKKKKKRKGDETIIELNNCGCPGNPCCCPPCCNPCGGGCGGGSCCSGSGPSGYCCQVDGCSNGVGNVTIDGASCCAPPSCYTYCPQQCCPQC